ncbi:MAG: alkaline phosphatase family protein [Actinobacteria bacterium]|nr:alkaline phosphatase family protein [Actinomycetota bacterium]
MKTAVVCLDGVDPRYVEDALERNIVPRLRELIEQGTYAIGRSQVPSFTNPNNLSIVTGAPPSVHGLPGNHYLDPDGNEVQLTDPSALRAPSILAALEPHDVSVLAVTTKDKLRRLLGTNGVPCVSAERAAELELAGYGRAASFVDRPPPGIYDWDCSHYALELAFALAHALDVELLYVSLTDFVQHSAAPGEQLSDAYLMLLDELVGMYLDDGWRLGLVADHGMNAKPHVRYLGDELARAGLDDAHVILPITDPYVVHHAALGSSCWVHVAERDRAAEVLGAVPGVEEVLTREDAADQLQLPADRIGDLVVLADAETALGRAESDHDLAALRGSLRSHGGRHEQSIPILLSEPNDRADGASNADVFHLLIGA